MTKIALHGIETWEVTAENIELRTFKAKLAIVTGIGRGPIGSHLGTIRATAAREQCAK